MLHSSAPIPYRNNVIEDISNYLDHITSAPIPYRNNVIGDPGTNGTNGTKLQFHIGIM